MTAFIYYYNMYNNDVSQKLFICRYKSLLQPFKFIYNILFSIFLYIWIWIWIYVISCMCTMYWIINKIYVFNQSINLFLHAFKMIIRGGTTTNICYFIPPTMVEKKKLYNQWKWSVKSCIEIFLLLHTDTFAFWI